jgi:hypothetical protein
MRKSEVFGIITVTVLIIILIVHITFPTPPDKIFENQFVKFNYSSNFNLVDKSNSTSIFVIIYNGDPSKKNIVGTIFLGDVNKTNEQKIKKTAVNGQDTKKTIISGYDAIVAKNQGDPGAEVYLNDNNGLFILVEPSYESDVDTIINSLIIKKAPTDVTSNTLFYEMNH